MFCSIVRDIKENLRITQSSKAYDSDFFRLINVHIEVKKTRFAKDYFRITNEGI